MPLYALIVMAYNCFGLLITLPCISVPKPPELANRICPRLVAAERCRGLSVQDRGRSSLVWSGLRGAAVAFFPNSVSDVRAISANRMQFSVRNEPAPAGPGTRPGSVPAPARPVSPSRRPLTKLTSDWTMTGHPSSRPPWSVGHSVATQAPIIISILDEWRISIGSNTRRRRCRLSKSL